MAKSESLVQKEIMMKLNRGNSRVFRNNVGTGYTRSGNIINFGLMKGSGDLIGWETIEITPDMVGQKIARFLSVEVKAEKGGRASKYQKQWSENVNNAGGRAVIANGVDELEKKGSEWYDSRN